MVSEPKTRPALTTEQAIQISEGRFGVPTTSATSLPSDRDQNFLLRHEASGRQYVLKLSHAEEDPHVLDFQNRMLEHLTRAGFPLANVLFATDGKELVAVPGEDGSVFLARLLSWVPGEQLYQVKPHSPSLLESLGTFLGGMDRALEDFSHPAQDRDLKWDLKQAGRVVRTHLNFVKDLSQRELLEEMSGRCLERLGPLVPDLRISVIHGDANDHNVLVGEWDPREDRPVRKVAGLVDFGDAVRSYTVGELAIAGAYAMLGKADPVEAAVPVVRGYHRALPLKGAEIEAIFPLMGLRLCASVAISAHQRQLEPENEYLSVSEAPAWKLLRNLERETQGFPTLLFRQACGWDPVPSSGRLVGWLGTHGPQASPVVGKGTPDATGTIQDYKSLDLAVTPVHIFDLRGDSEEFPSAPETEDAQGWSQLLFGKMQEEGAEAGIGRYDEVRKWYTADAFRGPNGDPPEWRTVHLGVDIFLPPGSPVLAPFDGIVHSVANNGETLDYGPAVILEHRVGLDTDEPLTFWTLYGHLAPGVLSQLYPGQPIPRGQAFAQIGDFPDNGDWAPHLHFQIVTDCLGHQGEFPGVGSPSQREIWKALSPDPNLILGIPGRTESTPSARRRLRPGPSKPGRPSGAALEASGGRTKEEILECRWTHLGPSLSIAYEKPLKIVRGRGQYLYDDNGQAYLDCVNNVPHVGHNHPRVVRAGQDQMAILNTNTRYLHDSLVDYTERLLATLPDPLSVVYLVCTGSEANELALRMARTHTERKDVVVLEGAYHGNTSALVDLSPYKFDRTGGEGAPDWVHQALIPDTYRGQFRALEFGVEVPAPAQGGSSQPPPEYLPREELGSRYAQHLRGLLDELASTNQGPSAFFCESLLGCGGQIVLPEGYMAQAFQHVRTAGGICIADEVQVGFGRVGSHFWAFETQGVVPDIVTLGKPMANGHPMAAVVTTPEIAASFTTGMEYFNTFGGNPVSCAMGMAVLDVIEDEELQENALIVGGHLLASLSELKNHHSVVGDVRGIGLYLGVELVEDRVTREPAPERAARVKERLREQRILLSTDGPQDNVLKIKPPLCFTRDNADRLTEALDRILEEDGIRVV